jgi:hypothetical protein
MRLKKRPDGAAPEDWAATVGTYPLPRALFVTDPSVDRWLLDFARPMIDSWSGPGGSGQGGTLYLSTHYMLVLAQGVEP